MACSPKTSSGIWPTRVSRTSSSSTATAATRRFSTRPPSRSRTRSRVRILVVNWWTLADDITKSVFKQNGGHAGNNETAYVQAIVPNHIHPERYAPEMASPNAPAGAYFAVPVTSSIGLYEKGQGYPTFDPAQASEYFRKVNDRVAELILDTIKKWDLSGVYK